MSPSAMTAAAAGRSATSALPSMPASATTPTTASATGMIVGSLTEMSAIAGSSATLLAAFSAP